MMQQARYVINEDAIDPLLHASIKNGVVQFLSTKDSNSH